MLSKYSYNHFFVTLCFLMWLLKTICTDFIHSGHDCKSWMWDNWHANSWCSTYHAWWEIFAPTCCRQRYIYPQENANYSSWLLLMICACNRWEHCHSCWRYTYCSCCNSYCKSLMYLLSYSISRCAWPFFVYFISLASFILITDLMMEKNLQFGVLVSL